MKTTIDLPIAKWLYPNPEASTYRITIDREDKARILACTWNAIHDSLGDITPYTNVGSDADPIYLPLANLILGLSNDVFVERVFGAAPNDFRRKALKR